MSLRAALLEIENEQRENVRSQIKARREKGIPLDDNADPEKLTAHLDAARDALAMADYPRVREYAFAVIAETAGSLAEPEALAPDAFEEFDAVQIAPRAISESARARLGLRYDNARLELASCKGEAVADALDAFRKVQLEYVANCYAEIEGLKRLDGSPLRFDSVDGKLQGVEVLAASSVADALVRVALHWQRLPAKKAAAFGLSAR